MYANFYGYNNVTAITNRLQWSSRVRYFRVWLYWHFSKKLKFLFLLRSQRKGKRQQHNHEKNSRLQFFLPFSFSVVENVNLFFFSLVLDDFYAAARFIVKKSSFIILHNQVNCAIKRGGGRRTNFAPRTSWIGAGLFWLPLGIVNIMQLHKKARLGLVLFL